MILYFTGTGNSRFVADELAARLSDTAVRMDMSGHFPQPTDDRCVVWIFPVHAWSVPPVVARYILSLPDGVFANDARHYMVATCGDDIGRTDRVWRALMRARGWDAAGAYSVQMPNTYVLLPGFDVDSPEVESEKLRKAEARIDEIAKAIRGGKDGVDVVPGGFPVVKTRLLGPVFRRFLMSPKPFRVDTSRCNSCGRCVKNCPMENIVMADGLPKWGAECAMCLACYHGCMSDAVEYGSATRKKGRYRGPYLGRNNKR